ncbi:uncharacterized protein LOC143028342 isoform X2 [Oratosquilla oratoria]
MWSLLLLVMGMVRAADLPLPPVIEPPQTTPPINPTSVVTFYNTHTMPPTEGEVQSTTVINRRYSSIKYKKPDYITTAHQDPDLFYWRTDVKTQSVSTTNITELQTSMRTTATVTTHYQEIEYPHPTVIYTDKQNMTHTFITNNFLPFP